MELWTDYEGKTIDGAYTLVKLLEPEGRSAFFSATNGTEKQTVVRLIESHFDDAEILARWRSVAELGHANLIELSKFGQVELDGTSLVYAAMEPAEANLGEVLRERRLTAPETRQIAESLLAALEALHAKGLVHGHVEPGNVLAVGETIKLRSDCVREAAEGEDGRVQVRRDVHDLAVVLLQALTQQRTMEAAIRDLPLEAPFDQIVRRGIGGEWGLEEMGAALKEKTVSQPAASASQAVSASPTTAPQATGQQSAASVVSQGESGAASNVRVMRPVDRGIELEESDGGDSRKIAYGVGALVVLLLVGWLLVRGCSSSEKSPAQVAAPAAVSAPSAPQAEAAPVAAVRKPAPGVPTGDVPRQVPVEARAAAGGGTWRVVAFTYNHRDQAQHKAETIAKEHPGLHPDVFTPTGGAPYLVTLGGGGMSQEAAFALSGKAKREGLPRDVYARNYRR